MLARWAANSVENPDHKYSLIECDKGIVKNLSGILES